jgi:tetratricopeptide (TPR) repeat protein
MTAMTRNRRQAILRQAAGYVELAELLVDPHVPTPASAHRLLDRALAALDELPEPTRSMPETLLLEGEALRAAERWEEAIIPLSRAAAEAPQHAAAWLAIGWCHKRLGRMQQAVDALENGLSHSPAQAILHYNLACYLSLMGRVPAAVEHLTRAIAIDTRFRDLTSAEPDFDPIRSDPRFVAVTDVAV